MANDSIAVVRLERADPPEAVRVPPLTERIAALLPEVRAAGGAWFRVASWPTSSTAAATRRRLEERPEFAGFELRTGGRGRGSDLYVRWAGDTQGGKGECAS